MTFDSQGGSSLSPASKVVTYGQEYGTLAPTTREGYTFGGWWTEASGTGTQMQSSTTVSITANQTLFAKWDRNTYTVTFDKQGGSNPNPASKSVTYGLSYGTLPAIIQTGYTFDGWWTGANGTGTQVLSTSVVSITSNQTLYAKWSFMPFIGPSGGMFFTRKNHTVMGGDIWRRPLLDGVGRQKTRYIFLAIIEQVRTGLT
ncbi:MAG: InlB B-repeat-containing protein [Sphaerochaeta sp.]